MNKAYLLLGSNEGDRKRWLHEAIKSLGKEAGIIVQQSHMYETAAWGLEDQPDFLNMAVCLHTGLSDAALLTVVNSIEEQLGRQRAVKWGQRTLDIDILFYNDEIINSHNLEIPHPYLQERRFALAPLNEIAPGFVHPVFQKTVSALLEECPDKLEVRVIS